MVFHTAMATMRRNIIVYFFHGVVLGIGVNYYFSYQVMTHLRSIEFYVSLALSLAPLISFLFFEQKYSSRVKPKQKIKLVLLGITASSTIIAFYSFILNYIWFISGGPLTHVMVPIPGVPGEYTQLTVYPPDLIYNLLKSTFIATVSGFVERIVTVS